MYINSYTNYVFKPQQPFCDCKGSGGIWTHNHDMTKKFNYTLVTTTSLVVQPKGIYPKSNMTFKCNIWICLDFFPFIFILFLFQKTTILLARFEQSSLCSSRPGSEVAIQGLSKWRIQSRKTFRKNGKRKIRKLGSAYFRKYRRTDIKGGGSGVSTELLQKSSQ